MTFIEEQTLADSKSIVNYLPQLGINDIREEIVAGLRAKQKYISPKYFYDKIGSELFEQITHLEEYYPTGCEKEILTNIVSKIDIDFFELDIIELGSGDSSKIKTLFRQIPSNTLASINYYPVDISESAIENSIQDLVEEFDLNRITGIVADFHHHHHYMPRRNKRLFCFLGSTIGNFTPTEVANFMTELGEVMNQGDGLLLGVDMVKEVWVLNRAYNDSKGITAAFNKNILRVVNNHLLSNFDPNDFNHLAFYNQEKRRVEMHLTAKRDIQITFAFNNETISIQKGESIHTENSNKLTNNLLEKIGKLGGMKIKSINSDTKGWFNLVHYSKMDTE